MIKTNGVLENQSNGVDNMNLVEKLMNVPDIKETDGVKNPTVHLKFENILGRGSWYVTEMGAIDDDDVLLYGYVLSPLGEDLDEWGYFTLSELLGTGVIFLEKNFIPQPIGMLVPEAIA